MFVGFQTFSYRTEREFVQNFTNALFSIFVTILVCKLVWLARGILVRGALRTNGGTHPSNFCAMQSQMIISNVCIPNPLDFLQIFARPIWLPFQFITHSKVT